MTVHEIAGGRGQTWLVIDEGLTDVLRRRIVASLIDLGVVGGLTLLFARSQSERFAILERDDAGRAVFSQADADRVEAIAREFNRTQEIGDTLYAFKGIDILFILVVGALLTLLAKVLIPANTGWSLGQRIMGLRVINDELGLPTTSQHLRRTFGGIVDFFPYVIPGLAGWLMARSKPFKRRFGDTLADTAVISTRVETDETSTDSADVVAAPSPSMERIRTDDAPPPPAPTSVEATPPPPAASPVGDAPAPGVETPAPEEVAAAATAPAAGAAPPADALPPAGAPPVEDSPASRLQQAANRAEAHEPRAPFEPPTTVTPDDAPEIDISEPASPLGAALARAVDPTPPEPVAAGAADTSELPVDELAVPDAPEIETPAAETTTDVTQTDDTPIAEPRTPAFPTVAARTDRPLPSHRTEAERQQLFKATNAPIDLTERAVEPSEKKLPPPPRHRAVRSDWERPIAEAAPVWGPDDLAALEKPVEAEALQADPVAEPTQADAVVTETAVETARAGVTEAGTEAAASETTAATPEQKEPQWSDEWDSWLYWDAAHSAWLRHDTESGRWVPID